MAEPVEQVEVTGPGFGVKTSGVKLTEWIWLPIVLMIGWLVQTQYAHGVDTKDEKAAVANKLVESQKIIADSLRESNNNNAAIMREVVQELKRNTKAVSEVACLSDPAMKNRQDAREACKRLVGSDR